MEEVEIKKIEDEETTTKKEEPVEKTEQEVKIAELEEKIKKLEEENKKFKENEKVLLTENNKIYAKYMAMQDNVPKTSQSEELTKDIINRLK